MGANRLLQKKLFRFVLHRNDCSTFATIRLDNQCLPTVQEDYWQEVHRCYFLPSHGGEGRRKYNGKYSSDLGKCIFIAKGENKMRASIGALVLVILIISAYCAALFGEGNANGKIEPEKLEFLTDGSQSLQNPWTFCTTGDGLIIIPDKDAGNIKIFKESGKYLTLETTIGRKGFGENELYEPAYCFYDSKAAKLGVMDLERRSVVLYDHTENRLEFKKSGELMCPRLGYDVQLWQSELVISGDRSPNDKSYPEYSLFSVDANGIASFGTADLSDNIDRLILPSHRAYGLHDADQFEKFYSGVGKIGRKFWFDIDDNGIAYVVYEGSPAVIKVNLSTNAISPFISAQKKLSLSGFKHFVTPRVSPEMENAFNTGNAKTVAHLRNKMSYIKDLIVTTGHLLLLYTDYLIFEDKSTLRLRIYSLKGDFVNDVLLEGNPTWRVGFDKNNEILYSIAGEKGKFYLLRYKDFLDVSVDN